MKTCWNDVWRVKKLTIKVLCLFKFVFFLFVCNSVPIQINIRSSEFKSGFIRGLLVKVCTLLFLLYCIVTGTNALCLMDTHSRAFTMVLPSMPQDSPDFRATPFTFLVQAQSIGSLREVGNVYTTLKTRHVKERHWTGTIPVMFLNRERQPTESLFVSLSQSLSAWASPDQTCVSRTTHSAAWGVTSRTSDTSFSRRSRGRTGASLPTSVTGHSTTFTSNRPGPTP